MIAVSTSPVNISMLRKFNTWYSIADGSWDDPNIWISNGKKKYNSPQPGDNVYINHTVDYSNYISGAGIKSFNNIVGDLFIGSNGTFTASLTAVANNNIIVTGNLHAAGLIDFSGAVSSIILELRGPVNFIENFICGDKSSVYYNSPFDQRVLPFTYYNLEIGNENIKTTSADLFVNNNLTIDESSTLVLESDNATIGNIFFSSGTILKTSSGIVNLNEVQLSRTCVVSFPGNPVINISGNFFGDGYTSKVDFGSGIFNITENSTWAISQPGAVPGQLGVNTNVIIAAGKTLTISPSQDINSGGWINYGTITGLDSTATLNINGTYAYGSSNVAMDVGIMNHNFNGTSNIQVQDGVTMNLPFTSFYDLTLNGSVTLNNDTIVNRNLMVNGSLQMSVYNFTCNGLCSYNGPLLKSGSGTVNFNGLSSGGTLSFTGNPTVNLSGNFVGDLRNGANFGINPVNIISSLSFQLHTAGNIAPNTSTSIFIASGKTLINIGLSSALGGFNTTGTINGEDDTAVFDNRSMCNYANSQQPMQTGILLCNSAPNTFEYNSLDNQDITPITYSNLTLSGSGTKRLLGDVSVTNIYTLTSPATLDTNGFTLTNP